MTVSQPLRFCSWGAVSSAPQSEGESLPEQMRANRAWVAEIGRHYPGYSGEIVEELHVIGSRTIVDLADACKVHKPYERLVSGIRSGEFDAVICRSRDRLGRTDSLIYSIETLCLKHGVVVVARQSLPLTLDAAAIRASEDSGLIGVIEGFFATSTVRRLVNEHRLHMIVRVQKRKQFPSNLPWGYKYHYRPDGDKHIVRNEVAAATIRMLLIELFLNARMTPAGIADTLNERGVSPSRGATWTVDSVRNIIDLSERYAGYISINRRSATGRPYVLVRGDHEPILSEPEWQEIQAERKSRSATRVTDVRLFSGMVICTVSQKPMAAQTQHYTTKKGRVSVHTYRCRACERSHTIREEVVLEAVRNLIEQFESHDDIDVLIEAANENRASQTEQEIQRLQEQLVELELMNSRLQAAIINHDELATEQVSARLGQIRRQQLSIEANIAALESRVSPDTLAQQSAEALAFLQEVGTRILDYEPERAQQWLFKLLRIMVCPAASGTGSSIVECVII